MTYFIVRYRGTVQFWADGEWTKDRMQATPYLEGRQLEAAEELAAEIGGEVVEAPCAACEYGGINYPPVTCPACGMSR